MSKLRRIAMALQILLLMYLQLIEWIDMFPWNDIRRGNGQESLDIALGIVILGAIVATWRRWRPGMMVAALVYVAWTALQVMTFWVPYAVGASPKWARIHRANFAQTTQWLPTRGLHLPPDASHFLLQLILLAALVSTIAALRDAGTRRGRR